MRISKYLLGGSTICALLLLFSSPARSDTIETAQTEIRVVLEKWTKDFNAGNSAEVCKLFAPDLISSYQGQPDKGYEALCAQLLRDLDDPVKRYHYSLMLEEILVSGDLAVVRLKWLLKITQKGIQGESTVEDTGLDVFRRQADGTWKIIRFIAYPSSPK